MRRTITLLLTVALVGSMITIGASGALAADKHDHDHDTDEYHDHDTDEHQKYLLVEDQYRKHDYDKDKYKKHYKDKKHHDKHKKHHDKHHHKDAIESITFYQDYGNLHELAEATWNGERFVIETHDPNDDVSVTVTEYDKHGDPVEVEWEFEGVGQKLQGPHFVRTTSESGTCDFDVDTSTYPYRGTATGC
jgi:hypothetical protein